jgi:4-amino-4-deoxy-L-arabinose transferase-like glycosyltransferase
MSDARFAALLFAAALLARLVSWMGLCFFGPDSANFLIMADWMGEGRFQDALAMAYHPFYPLLIAVAKPLAGGSVAAGHAISILLGAAATVPLFNVAKAVFGRPAAFISALTYAFHPRIVDVQSDVMTEATFMFLFVSSMWLTWRMMEEPSPERGVVLGLASAAAFLTRPEGILAIMLALGWPVVEILRRREAGAKRIGEVLLMLAVILVALSPYLFWVKSVRGHWAFSIRPSLISAERATGIYSGPEDRGSSLLGAPKLYKDYVQSILRLNLHGALFPFHLIGLASLGGLGLRRGLFYFSFLGGLLGGVLYTLRQHNAMSDRYLMVAMTLFMALAGVGIVSAFRHAARRWPEARWRPAACATLILLIAVIPGLRWLSLRRLEDRSFSEAARWIRSQGNPSPSVSGTSQVAYLSGGRILPLPSSPDEIRRDIDVDRVGFFVYDSRDLKALSPTVKMLASCQWLEPAVKIEGPPGTLNIYVQRVK